MNDDEEIIESIETVEKPTKQKRKASEKQKAHLQKIQTLAIEKKKQNKEITDTISNYEKRKKQLENHNMNDFKNDLLFIKNYINEEQERKKMKREAKNQVDKETYEQYQNYTSNDYINIFR